MNTTILILQEAIQGFLAEAPEKSNDPNVVLMRLFALSLDGEIEAYKINHGLPQAEATERAFFDEYLRRDPNASIQSSVLYRAYRVWCEANNAYAKNMNQVAIQWQQLGLKKQVKNGRHYWRGARFITEEV